MAGLKELEWAQVPDSHRYISRRLQEGNYLQAMEGGLDSSHVSFLHRDATHVSEKTAGSVLRGKGKGREFVQGDTSPKFEVREVEYGLLIGARRNADDDNYYWRISQWLMPWYTLIPPYGEAPLRGHAWVPVDDEHCWVYNFSCHPPRPLTREEITEMHADGFHFEMTQPPNRPIHHQ